MNKSDEFGFEIRQERVPAFEGRTDPGFEMSPHPEITWWEVSLPHQCDRWVIADSAPPYDPPDYWSADTRSGTRKELIPAMERFIVQAQAVLDRLRDEGDESAHDAT